LRLTEELQVGFLPPAAVLLCSEDASHLARLALGAAELGWLGRLIAHVHDKGYCKNNGKRWIRMMLKQGGNLNGCSIYGHFRLWMVPG
jgi:hypothetical protein